MHKIYFHIGMGKTGSSALQSYLAVNAIPKTINKERLVYVTINESGSCLYGDTLINKLSNKTGHFKGLFRVIASEKDVFENKNNLITLRRDIQKIFDKGLTPIISQEGWAWDYKAFAKNNFFNLLNCSAHLIAYVRPQIDWLNSAWWEWYAWNPKYNTPLDVIKSRGFAFLNWGEIISRWKTVPGVENMSIRLHCNDIVSDFLSVVGVNNKKIKKKANSFVGAPNTGLSPLLIKLFLRSNNLNSTDSRYKQKILASHLQFAGRPPWVINNDLAKLIIENTKESNSSLVNLLDPDLSTLMEKDDRWWSTKSYSDKVVWKDTDYALSKDELLETIDLCFNKIIKLHENQKI